MQQHSSTLHDAGRRMRGLQLPSASDSSAADVHVPQPAAGSQTNGAYHLVSFHLFFSMDSSAEFQGDASGWLTTMRMS